MTRRQQQMNLLIIGRGVTGGKIIGFKLFELSAFRSNRSARTGSLDWGVEQETASRHLFPCPILLFALSSSAAKILGPKQASLLAGYSELLNSFTDAVRVKFKKSTS